MGGGRGGLDGVSTHCSQFVFFTSTVAIELRNGSIDQYLGNGSLAEKYEHVTSAEKVTSSDFTWYFF